MHYKSRWKCKYNKQSVTELNSTLDVCYIDLPFIEYLVGVQLWQLCTVTQIWQELWHQHGISISFVDSKLPFISYYYQKIEKASYVPRKNKFLSESRHHSDLLSTFPPLFETFNTDTSLPQYWLGLCCALAHHLISSPTL